MIRARRFALHAALVAALLLLGASGPTVAEPPTRSQIPEPLRPWIDWVLLGHEEAACPVIQDRAAAESDGSDGGDPKAGGGRLCAWPSRLALDVDERGGRFTQEWLVARDLRVPLPGDASIWPLDVTVDGRAAAVVAQGDRPSIRLVAGRHRLAGWFEWSSAPPTIRVPPETGLFDLTLRGRPVPFPVRDAEGRVWLQKQEGTGEEESRQTLTVHRRAEDDVPFRLLTRLDLRVSGRSREVDLGRALPDGFVPMALRAPFPARLDERGRLIAQVRPGAWTLEIDARHEGPVGTLEPPAAVDPWPAEEIWVWEARPELRQVGIEGASIDPQQTTLPSEWKALPAYVLRAGAGLRLVEKQRGDATPAPDRLTLQRTLWLDFDGRGYTSHDEIAGTFVRSWRLEMPAPAALGRAAIDGVDQVVTRQSAGGPSGIEIRKGAAEIAADGRIPERRAVLRASGWDAEFQSVAIDLHLPPGWRLLHARGVDDVDATWISAWTLLDLFLLFVTTLAVARLWGRTSGLIALFALGLSWIEFGAPRWCWVAAVAAAAIAGVLRSGWMRSVARLAVLAAAVTLAGFLVPFLVQQVRAALYPALEEPMAWAGSMGSGGIGAVRGDAGYETAAEDAVVEERGQMRALGYVGGKPLASPPPPPPPMPGGRSDSSAGAMAEGYAGAFAHLDKARLSNLALDPSSSAQTGPGLPSWHWRQVELSWRGPVARTQEMRLWLLPPWFVRFLGFARVGLLAGLAFIVLRGGQRAAGRGATGGSGGAGGSGGPDTGGRAPARAVAAGLMATLVLPIALAAASTPARAEMPSPDLLNALRDRLLEPPDCGQECVTLPRLAVETSGATLRLRLEAHAAARVAAPLPGGAAAWTPARVFLDGAPAAGLARIGGRLFLDLAPGRHQVILEGPLADRDAVSIPLPLRPRRVSSRVEGWRLEGVSDEGFAEDTLQLVRLRPRAAGGGPLQAGSLPPFVRVERELEFGLRWETRTRVARLTPPGAAILVAVPLLPGESVTTAGVRVADGKAIASLSPDAAEVSWTSVLAVTPEVTLRAPESVPWVEVWRAVVGPVWHLEPQGLPPAHAAESETLRRREWHPWPGESLVLRIGRPEPVEGATLTIDGATLTLRPGLRMTDASLDLTVRASRGGDQALTLPEGAELQSVAINGAAQPIRQDGRQVLVPIVPGAQAIHVEWREPRAIATFFRSSAVRLGAEAVNLTTVLELSPDRWTLLLGGPQLGPAVLVYGLLAVSLLAALALGRLRLAPLGWGTWFLLSLGLTQTPIVATLVIVGWLLAFGWRRRSPRSGAVAFDAVQIVLAIWTVTALVLLFWAIQHGLLGRPEMQIEGNGSTGRAFRWFLDRSDGTFPTPWALSVPLFVYRLAMLAWALWLARAVLRWLRWTWECFGGDGGPWRPLPRPQRRGPREPAAGGSPKSEANAPPVVAG